jgi:hypothetical protein
MSGQPDLANLLHSFDNADRTAGGGLLIQPARPGQRQEMARQRRELIETATKIVELGSFERNAPMSAQMKTMQP